MVRFCTSFCCFFLIDAAGASAVGTGQSLNPGSSALIAFVVTFPVAAFAGDGTGTAASAAVNRALAAAVAAILIVASAAGTYIMAFAAANIAAISFLAVAKIAVTPASAAAE